MYGIPTLRLIDSPRSVLMSFFFFFFFLRLHLLMPRLSSPFSAPHPTIQPSMSPCFRRAPVQEPRQRTWNPVPDLRDETSSWSGDQCHENVLPNALQHLGGNGLINHLIVLWASEGAPGNDRDCDSSCWTAVILKKINNGTKKALSEEMRQGGMRQRWSYCTASSEYHPINGKQNPGKELPNHSSLNELQNVQSDGSEFPRPAFSCELPSE